LLIFFVAYSFRHVGSSRCRIGYRRGQPYRILSEWREAPAHANGV